LAGSSEVFGEVSVHNKIRGVRAIFHYNLEEVSVIFPDIKILYVKEFK
jgi:hypothetical protein